MTFNNFMSSNKSLSVIHRTSFETSNNKIQKLSLSSLNNKQILINTLFCCSYSSKSRYMFSKYGYKFIKQRYDVSSYNKLYNDFLFIKHILLSKMQSDILNHIKKIQLDNADNVNDIYELNISNGKPNSMSNNYIQTYFTHQKHSMSKIDYSLLTLLTSPEKQRLLSKHSI